MKASTIRCLITAGPTREFFDPVRYLSNPSSGKMGYALAAAAVAQGWQTDIVSGPVSLTTPAGANRHDVVTGADMLERTAALFPDCDILIKTAAVMDYRPKDYSDHKIKKSGSSLVVELEPVTDILRSVAAGKQAHQLVVGFAAETNDIETYGLKKLREKNCDYVVANRVGKSGGGFESDRNSVVLLGPDGPVEEIGPDAKTAIANLLVTRFAAALEAKRSGSEPTH